MVQAADLVTKTLEFLQSLDELEDPEPALDLLAIAYYTPVAGLQEMLDEVELCLSKSDRGHAESKELGKKMERLASLVVHGIKGYNALETFQSATAQYDLLVNGDSPSWHAICGCLRISRDKRGLLFEVKGTQGPVEHAQFMRLCGALFFGFPQTVSLGVFFTLSGATGFPKPGEKQLKLGQSRLQQALFYAYSRTPIVVLDWDDIRTLNAPGAFLQCLSRKVRELEKLGTPVKPGSYGMPQIELPEHMRP